MRKELIANMVPISVKSPNDIWYMDISNLSLSELINLKEELKGYSNQSIRVLDAIIHKNAGTTYEETYFDSRNRKKQKEGYKNRRTYIKSKKKKR